MSTRGRGLHAVLRERAALVISTLATLTLLLGLAPGSTASALATTRGIAPTGRAAIHFLGTRQSARVGFATQPNLTYHGGKVMRTTSTTYAIFWEPPTLQDTSAATVSPTYNALMVQYMNDVGGRGLYKNNTQYYQKTGTTKYHILNSSSFGGQWTDATPYPASDCVDAITPNNCISDADAQAEVTAAMTANGWTGGRTHLFMVFTSKGEGSCAGSQCAFTEYCAYHSFFMNGATPVLYAMMPYTGTSLPSCGTPTSPNSDADADSTINVLSHEHMEAVTDPQLNAWYDKLGSEIGDKCAWVFGQTTQDGGLANQSMNGHFYILQTEWDNAKAACVRSGP